jgi:hypothetical protein
MISFSANHFMAFISPRVKICTQLTENIICLPKIYFVLFWQSLIIKPTHVHYMFTFFLQSMCFCYTHSDWLSLLLVASRKNCHCVTMKSRETDLTPWLAKMSFVTNHVLLTVEYLHLISKQFRPKCDIFNEYKENIFQI